VRRGGEAGSGGFGSGGLERGGRDLRRSEALRGRKKVEKRCVAGFVRGIFVHEMMYVEWMASPPTQNQ
jgi:hypothetical protein